MNRSAVIFLAGIFLPSVLLGVLALRTAGEQSILIERQAAALYQVQVDALAADVRGRIQVGQAAFVSQTRSFLGSESPRDLANHFTERMRSLWPESCVAFAVEAGGQVVSPRNASSEEEGKFLQKNSDFIANRVQAEVYQTTPKADPPGFADDARDASTASVASGQSASYAWSGAASVSGDRKRGETSKEKSPGGSAKPDNSAPTAAAAAPLPATAAEAGVQAGKDRDASLRAPDAVPAEKGGKTVPLPRTVAPQQLAAPAPADTIPSRVTPLVSSFRQVTGDARDGIVARFVDDELTLFFWARPESGDDLVFGLAVPVTQIAAWLRESLQLTAEPDVCVAVLDDRARPVLRSDPSFETNWKRPFVASEVGDVLPHWESTLYLVTPGRFEDSARLIRMTLAALIILSLGAIAAAGYFVLADARRQMAMAQKKADFVSNVSHELKTPLTSIRMFAELLRSSSGDASKRDKYLRIITIEAERLTRLINNVLDFSRMERRQENFDFREQDLHPVIARAWEIQKAHLDEAGFQAEWKAIGFPFMVSADADAVSQILVNLLSNAEKYSGDNREVLLRTYEHAGDFVMEVLDRGCGIPAAMKEKVFEPFFRVHDSLSSGVQGSGLGLTLARRIAMAHAGTLEVESRPGGGTVVTLRIPLLGKSFS